MVHDKSVYPHGQHLPATQYRSVIGFATPHPAPPPAFLVSINGHGGVASPWMGSFTTWQVYLVAESRATPPRSGLRGDAGKG